MRISSQVLSSLKAALVCLSALSLANGSKSVDEGALSPRVAVRQRIDLANSTPRRLYQRRREHPLEAHAVSSPSSSCFRISASSYIVTIEAIR
ncbi:hypothetical protein C6P46_002602 [Rhodotorula mucilaginosa]|uniref:Uncharacterized protein n=1 Tax=Rhodotorula mucilaginosa TaxID=5537 RepID=A0A9P6W9U9_RHOMI|nr:hypothetical protein C6P46_002602 [Rhodotorula mucilaginosa]